MHGHFFITLLKNGGIDKQARQTGAFGPLICPVLHDLIEGRGYNTIKKKGL